LFADARRLIDEDDDIAAALPILEKANAEAANAQSTPIEELKYLTGEVLVRSDRGAEAETLFVDELHDFPHSLNARAALATLYLSMDQKDDAARVTSDLVRITPSPEAYATAAKLWTSLGDRKQAAAVRADARKLFASQRNAH
jgi:predicted Zn-dependent protease